MLRAFVRVSDAEWWGRAAADLRAWAERGQRAVEAAFGEQIDELEHAIDKTPCGCWIVLRNIDSGCNKVIERPRRDDDSHYSMIALA